MYCESAIRLVLHEVESKAPLDCKHGADGCAIRHCQTNAGWPGLIRTLYSQPERYRAFEPQSVSTSDDAQQRTGGREYAAEKLDQRPLGFAGD